MLKNLILVLVLLFAIPVFSKQNPSKKKISEMIQGSYQPHEGGYEKSLINQE
jgi:hypothetical protein